MLPVGTSKGIVHWYESHELWWFHRIWNNNETKGLCDFTVHAQLGRQQKYLEGGAAKTHVSVF